MEFCICLVDCRSKTVIINVTYVTHCVFAVNLNAAFLVRCGSCLEYDNNDTLELERKKYAYAKYKAMFSIILKSTVFIFCIKTNKCFFSLRSQKMIFILLAKFESFQKFIVSNMNYNFIELFFTFIA